MASVSTIRVTAQRDAVSQALSPVLENLDEDARTRIEQWLPEIEEEIQNSLCKLRHYQIKHRKRDTLLAAAMYDAFLKFESRTQTCLRTPQIAESLGQPMCVVNRVWTELFDNRAKLHYHRLKSIRKKCSNPRDLVPQVIDALRGALERSMPETEEWFSHIEAHAKDLLLLLPPTAIMQYDARLLSALAVYTASRLYHGKPLVNITYSTLSVVCGWSITMLSQTWTDVFSERCISSGN